MIQYKILSSILAIALIMSSCHTENNETMLASQASNKVVLSSEWNSKQKMDKILRTQ